MPKIISRYSERPPACQDQPDGHRIVSGHKPKMKMSPTISKAMRRYLIRSATFMCCPPQNHHMLCTSVTTSRGHWKTRILVGIAVGMSRVLLRVRLHAPDCGFHRSRSSGHRYCIPISVRSWDVAPLQQSALGVQIHPSVQGEAPAGPAGRWVRWLLRYGAPFAGCRVVCAAVTRRHAILPPAQRRVTSVRSARPPH